MSAAKYIATLLIGALAAILIIGGIASGIVASKVKDCETMGQFRHEDQVVKCNLEKP